MSNDALRFTLDRGTITAVFEFDDGRWKLDGPDRDETWTWQDGLVTKSKFDDGVWKITAYTDTDGDGVYIKSGVSFGTQPSSVQDHSLNGHDAGRNDDDAGRNDDDAGRNDDDDGRNDNDDGRNDHDDGQEEFDGGTIGQSTGTIFRGEEDYRFDIFNGSVGQVYENEHGAWRVKRIDANEQYRLDGADVLKVEAKHNGQEITRYTDSDGDGLFVELNEQWISTIGDSATPRIGDVLSHVHSDGDDTIAVRGGKVAVGGGGADRFVIREAAHIEVSDFVSNHDRIVFDTGLGLQSFDQLMSYATDTYYDGGKYIVHFGEHASLTLIGVTPENLNASTCDILS